MSELHSLRPFLHVSVSLVRLALYVLFPTERVGHTSLPQHQWGSVTAIVRLLWLIGQVEVQFYVLSAFCMFLLTYVAFYSLFLFMRFRQRFLMCLQAGRAIYSNAKQR